MRCGECGAELKLGPATCPLCGAEPSTESSKTRQPDVDEYQSNVRRLRSQLAKLRNDDLRAS